MSSPVEQVPLAPLGLGTAALGNLFQVRTDKDAREVIEAALAWGINHVDTAPYYGHGLAERRLGAVLRDSGFSPTISTKVGRVLRPLGAGEVVPDHGFQAPDPFVPEFDYSADGFMASLEGSAKRLGVDYFDMVLVHDLGHHTHGADHHKHLKSALDSGLPKLFELKAAGVIGAVGLGVNEIEIVDVILAHGTIDVVLLAGRHTLLDKSANKSGILTRLAARDVEIMLGGVFNSGVLIDPDDQRITFDYQTATNDTRNQALDLRDQVTREGINLPTAALGFCRSMPGIGRVLVGPGNLGEWAHITKWAETAIPASLLSHLRAQP